MSDRVVIVLQVRTSSSRLPAKCLLPVGGMPMAVLAARRAANSGRNVVVATSNSQDDDFLAEELNRHQLRVYRGSLDNVLERVVDAIRGVPDSGVVVRLTADNVFPDGRLIDEVVEEFQARGLEYLACGGEESGLPYGVSLEVTRAGHLRQAAQQAVSGGDREHVTPWVIRRYGDVCFSKYRNLRKSHFRCTVDSYDDYLVVQQLFARLSDPVNTPVAALVESLTGARYQPIASSPAAQLVLGSAQLGMLYGVANTRGVPTPDESERIVKTAIGNGIRWIDTARGYGASEAVLGDILSPDWAGRVRVVTKLSPLADCSPSASSELINACVDASVFESCAQLRSRRIDALMLHRATHLTQWDGAVWKRLLALRQLGLIGALGVSVQSPAELELALATKEVSMLQMPYNLLDWRWDGLVEKILARKASGLLTVHVRSTLLQGLLSSRDPRGWLRAHVEDPAPLIEWLRLACERLACADVPELCLRYVRSQEWIDGIVVGMESMEQLRANLRHFARPRLDASGLQYIVQSRPRLDERTLSPTQWRTEITT